MSIGWTFATSFFSSLFLPIALLNVRLIGLEQLRTCFFLFVLKSHFVDPRVSSLLLLLLLYCKSNYSLIYCFNYLINLPCLCRESSLCLIDGVRMGGQCSKGSSKANKNNTRRSTSLKSNGLQNHKLNPSPSPLEQQHKGFSSLPKSQSDDFYDGIPRFDGGLSQKSKSVRSTQAAVAKVCFSSFQFQFLQPSVNYG